MNDYSAIPGRARAQAGETLHDGRGRAVIFDNDGVIIDSEPMHIEADLRILAEYGVHWAPADLFRFIGVRDSEMWRILTRELQLPDSPDMLAEKKARIRGEVFAPHRIRPIDGIPELFAALRHAGWKVAVASSSQRSLIGPWLEAMGLLSRLDAFVAGDDVVHGKPHPEPYLLAAERLGTDAGRCVSVEDSPHGIASAKAAGCRCIAFRNPFGPPQDLSGADEVVDSIRDILGRNLLGL